jgi:ribonuclease J
LAKKAGVKPENTFVIENGQVLEMSASSVKETENLNLQKIAIVGGEYLEASDEAFSQRISLAKTGIVFTALIRNKKSKKLVTDPVIAPYGLIYKEGEVADEVQEEALDKIEDVYEDASQKENLQELVRIEMRRFYKKRASHKPVVIPLILDI